MTQNLAGAVLRAVEIAYPNPFARRAIPENEISVATRRERRRYPSFCAAEIIEKRRPVPGSGRISWLSLQKASDAKTLLGVVPIHMVLYQLADRLPTQHVTQLRHTDHAMQSAKQLAIDTLSAYKFPLASLKLLQEIRRVREKNSGPPLHDKNLCEVAEACSEDLYEFIKHDAHFRFHDDSEMLCKHGRLKLTREGYDHICEYLSEVFKYQSELRAMSEGDIESLFRQQDENQAAAQKATHTSDDRFAFFNSKAAEARLEYWLRLPRWTIDEAVALSFGKDPSIVNREKLRAFPRHPDSPFCSEYLERLEFVERATEANVLAEPLAPTAFASWCRGQNIALPADMLSYKDGADELSTLRIECDRLRREMEKLQGQRYDEVAGRPKRSTLLKIIIGMAIARFEHRTEKSSSAVGMIEKRLVALQISEKNLNQAKISVSNDIIRRVLAEAATELDLRWEEEIGWRGTRRL